MDHSDINDSQAEPEPFDGFHPLTRSSTNSTASNLPGPGRTLGVFYDFVGGHIETLINKAARARGLRPSPNSQLEHTEAFDDLSRTSTNSTASNLPGPGRTLGVFYDFVGDPIEVILGKTAERMGKGPRVTAQRIRRRRTKVIFASLHVENPPCTICPEGRCSCGNYCRCIMCWHDSSEPLRTRRRFRSPASIKGKGGKIENDCERLLEYVKSNVPSTRKQAVDHLLDLSVNDDYVRALLKSMGATKTITDSVRIYSRFRHGGHDELLLSSSQKALLSLSDSKINTLLQEWVTLLEYGSECPSNRHKVLRSEITPYFEDSINAFLIMRVFRRLVQPAVGLEWCPDIIESMLSSIAKSPLNFEWEECDIVLGCMLKYLLACPLGLQHVIAECILRFADKLPRVIESKKFQELSLTIGELRLSELDRLNSRKQLFVKGIISAWGSGTDTLSVDTLQKVYPYPTLQPVLSRLACPLEHAMRNVFNATYSRVWRKVPTSAEVPFYNEIARCIESPDPMLRKRAWDYANYFLPLDIYRCNMMLQALSTTVFATSENFSNFEKEKRENCIPETDDYPFTVYRHWDRNSNQIHLGSRYTPGCYRRLCDPTEEYELAYLSRWKLDFVLERGMAFSGANLHPIVAGRGRDMQSTYVAEVTAEFECIECGLDGVVFEKYAIAEGTKPEDLRIEVQCHTTVILVPTSVTVHVLRYAPDACAKHSCVERLGFRGDGLDATGPFSWTPARPYTNEWPDYCSRVINAIEAQTEEEIPSEQGRVLEVEDETASNSELDGLEYLTCNDHSETEAYPGSGDETKDECDSESSNTDFLSCIGTGETETDIDSIVVNIPTCGGGMKVGSLQIVGVNADGSGG